MLTATAGIETPDNLEILTKMPNFSDHLSAFKLGLADIHKAALIQQDHPLTTSEDKEAARETLENHMLEVSTIINAFAVNTKKAGVAQGYAAKEYVFKRMKDRELELEAKNIIKLATQWEDDLVPYGLTKNDTRQLQEAASAFTNLIPVPGDNQRTKKGSTQMIRDGFKRADTALGFMDALVNTQRTKAPEFYADYWSRRVVIDLPSHTISLRGVAKDSNGSPLKNVKVAIDGTQRAAKTTATGAFQFRRLPDGVYILRFTRPGFEDLMYTAVVNNGIKTIVTVQMRETT